MKRRTVLTIYSGMGMADRGYIMAGYEPIGAVELHPPTAEVYRANIGPHVRVGSATETDWRTFDRPDLLHASPPCPNFSRAKAGARETPQDLALADAVCAAITTLTPPIFVLENVIGYRRSESLARILRTLAALGYYYTLTNYNSADAGVPQTRVRLIVRAVRGWLVPQLPPPARPWVGWYDAIADLIPTLPESAFAPWQLARLGALFGDTLVMAGNINRNGGLKREKGSPATKVIADAERAPLRAFLVDGQNGGRPATVLAEGDPAMTVAAAVGHRPANAPRALLIGGGNTQLAQVDSHPRDADAPASTVVGSGGATTNQRAFIVDDQNGAAGATEGARGLTIRQAPEPVFTVQAGHNKPARAWLDAGRVVAMTPRALARFQSLPDGDQLPDNRALACRAVGDGLPCLMAKAIGESLLGVLP